VGVVGHTGNPSWTIYRREIEPAGRTLGLALDFAPMKGLGDLDMAVSGAQKRGIDAILVMHQPLTFVNREHVVEAVARTRLPAMYGSREAVELGGLMSYAVSLGDIYRRAALIVDKVLQGAKPADLPVEQPTAFELAVNLRTAKSLGLTLPPSLLLRAERVVE
jgi:putative ABC transport system substrate-binding protein